MGSTSWTDEQALAQALRRRARHRGLEFAKAYGQTCYFLFDRANRGRTATVYYSLAEAAAALTEPDPPAG